MMSRITLALRKYAKPDEDDWLIGGHSQLSAFRAAPGTSPLYNETHRHPNRRQILFGSYSAHAETLVPPPVYLNSTNSDISDSHAQGRVQLNTFAANAPTPVFRSPVQTFVEWTLGVGGLLRPERRSAPSSGAATWGDDESQCSRNSQEEYPECIPEIYELDRVRTPKKVAFHGEV